MKNKHQPVTSNVKHLSVSAFSSGTSRIKKVVLT